MQTLSIIPQTFAPSTSLTGGEGLSIFRGKNCRLEGLDGFPKIVSYKGNKNLNETYDISGETLTGLISWADGDVNITGLGTLFTTELRPGQMVFGEKGGDTEVLVVNKIVNDELFIADRAPTTTVSGADAYFMFGSLFEIDGKRGVLRRGNGIKEQKGDLIIVGDGKLFLSGTDSGFRATRKPKKLERQNDGSYEEKPIGFATPPAQPVIDGVTGGTKVMNAGNYSFMVSWFNSRNKGYSNPSEVIKKDSVTNKIVIAENGRIRFDFTVPCAIKTFDDSKVTIATGNINITAHGRVTGDTIKLRNFSGTLPVASTGGGLTEVKTYYVIKVDNDNIKLARTAALAQAGTAILYASAAGGGTHVLYSIPANADGFRIYQSLSGGNVAAVNTSYYSQGPWLKAKDVLLTDLDSSHRYFLEALDSELGGQASGDNDAPPDAEFVAEFSNYLFYISALGNTTVSKKEGTSPGNYVLMNKLSNKESAPPDWAVTVEDEITGFAKALGRMFCLTRKGIPFVSATGKPEVSRIVPTLLDQPFTSRPFWTKGGISPHQITTVQGDLFIWSGKKLLMSPRNGDQYANPFELSQKVDDLTANWSDGHVLVKNDPETQSLCVISSATKKNAAGFWISEILPLDLSTNTWQPVIEISSDTRDMVICAAEVIDNRLEFLAGGRDGGGGFELQTFRFNESDGSPVDWYFLIQPTDSGQERLYKKIHSVRITARINAGVVKFYGSRRGDTISIEDMETGTNAILTVNLPNSANITYQYKKRFLLKRLALWALRLSGTWDGSGAENRVDEIAVEIDTHGN